MTGSVTKVGNRMVRTAFYETASVMLTCTVPHVATEELGARRGEAPRNEEGAPRLLASLP